MRQVLLNRRSKIGRLLQFAVVSFLVLLATAAFATSIPNIEARTNWETCSSCALIGGGGPSVNHNVWYFVGAPSLNGKSAQFNISGSFPYADAIWWNQLGGNAGASNFSYDLYFFVKDTWPIQALEFDVNQSTGGRKYTYGTQCGVNYDRQWDVWDTAGHTWRQTGIPCNVIPYAWNHVTVQASRSGGWIHYVSITLNGVTSYVNQSFNSIPSGAYEINVAFQMDQTGSRTPYAVWLNNVTLNYW